MHEGGFIGRSVAVLAALCTVAAIVWSSSLPLFIGWRLYSEQVLLFVLSSCMAIAFLTRQRVRGRILGPDLIDKSLAIVALIWGAVGYDVVILLGLGLTLAGCAAIV